MRSELHAVHTKGDLLFDEYLAPPYKRCLILTRHSVLTKNTFEHFFFLFLKPSENLKKAFFSPLPPFQRS